MILSVDGHEFEVLERQGTARCTFDYRWLTRHKGNYGFTAAGVDVSSPNHQERIHNFLEAMDPKTGYPPDE